MSKLVSVEFAVPSPNSYMYSGTYIERPDTDLFYRIGGSTSARRDSLASNDAQFHKIDVTVPGWKKPTDLAVEQLRKFADEMEEGFYPTWATKVRDAVALIEKAV